MKKLLMSRLLVFLFAATGLTACTKKIEEARATTEVQVAGNWTGTYQTAQLQQAAQPVNVTIFANGTLTATVTTTVPVSATLKQAGTWTMNGNTLNYSVATTNYISVIKQEGSFTFVAPDKLIDGKWKNTTAENGVFYSGTFSTLTKH
jgi:spermidine/putrescine-binding protein